MALDAAVIIRAGSGALFVLLGLVIIPVSRRNVGALALAALLLSLGGALTLNNLQRAATTTTAILPFLFVVAGVSAVAVALLLPRRIALHEWPAAAAGTAVGLVVLASELMSVDADPAGSAGILGASGGLLVTFFAFFAGLTAHLTIISLRVALGPRHDVAGWKRAFALMAPVGLYGVFSIATLFKTPASLGALIGSIVLVGTLSVAWLIASARSGGARIPRSVALGASALGLLGYVYLLVPGNSTAAFYDAYGALGMLRIVGWAVLVYGILRWDVLGVPLPRIAVSRGALAAGALATLFIVAQIAQNFFSAEFGLLTGGIVAGAFLFAAQPLQRAMESMRERPTRSARADPALAPAEWEPKREAYRRALRLALRDRVLTADEEVELAHVAHELGLSAPEAVRLRHDIEREKGVR